MFYFNYIGDLIVLIIVIIVNTMFIVGYISIAYMYFIKGQKERISKIFKKSKVTIKSSIFLVALVCLFLAMIYDMSPIAFDFSYFITNNYSDTNIIIKDAYYHSGKGGGYTTIDTIDGNSYSYYGNCALYGGESAHILYLPHSKRIKELIRR